MEKKLKLIAALLISVLSIAMPKVAYAADGIGTNDSNVEEKTNLLTTIERNAQSANVSVSQLKATDGSENADWSIFYNKETGRFNVIYTIINSTESEVVLDLTQVSKILNACGQADFATWGLTEEDIQGYKDKGKKYLSGSMDYGNGQSFKIDLDTLLATTTTMPGDRIYFDVTIKNESGKTYNYRTGSLVVATGKLDVTDGDVKGFDGQLISSEYTKDPILLGYSYNGGHTAINDLVDLVLELDPIKTKTYYYVTAEGELSKTLVRMTIPAGTELVKIGSYYYAKVGEYYTGRFGSTKINTATVDGVKVYTLKADNTISATAYNASGVGQTYESIITRAKLAGYSKEVKALVQKYLDDNYEGSYEKYLVDYFNKKSGTSYTTMAEVLANDKEAAKDLCMTISVTLATLDVSNAVAYDNFFEHLFSIKMGADEDVRAYAKENSDSWGTKDGSTTIAEYMYDKVDTEKVGAWDETDKFFNGLLTEFEDGKETSFTLGINLDGIGTGNTYQDYGWTWYASITLDLEEDPIEPNPPTEEIIETPQTGVSANSTLLFAIISLLGLELVLVKSKKALNK